MGNTTDTSHIPAIEYELDSTQSNNCLFFKQVNSQCNSGIRNLITQQVGVHRKHWFSIINIRGEVIMIFAFFTPQPSGLEGYCRHGPGGRAGGRAGGCQTCRTHISVTAWWIFSVRSSMELSRPVVVHCHAHLPICPIWACPWAENLSNLPQIGSRLCGSHISETAGWIYPI